MHTSTCLAALAACAPGLAQESTRTLDRPGEHNKHLTVDTVDRWLLDGRLDEVLRVDARSSDFDPVLELVRLDDAGRVAAVLVPEVDDPGGWSRMLLRLPSAGPLAILVHGPGQRGGGNYRLYVERLSSTPLPDGAEFLSGALDRDGNAHVRVVARAGETLVPRGSGVTEVIDPKGVSLTGWQGCYEAERDGEHFLRVHGRPLAPFRVGLAPVRRRALELGADVTERLADSGLDEWTFTAREHGFHVLEVEGADLDVRVVADGPEPPHALDGGPTHRWLPAHSKGATRRSVLVTASALARRVQVRALLDRATPYRLTLRDPSAPLATGAPTTGALAVGGSDYWTFAAEPGQVLQLDVESGAFDPVLRLFDEDGTPLGEFDGGGAGLAARHTWLATRRGVVRAEVLSYGNGGGGAYAITLTDLVVPAIEVGGRRAAELRAGAVDHWHLAAEGPRDVLLLTRSDDLETGLSLFDPDGIELATNWGSGPGRGALLGVRLPRAGRYTLAVTGRGGDGAYMLRVLDPDE
jgi:hypothetical protein